MNRKTISIHTLLKNYHLSGTTKFSGKKIDNQHILTSMRIYLRVRVTYTLAGQTVHF